MDRRYAGDSEDCEGTWKEELVLLFPAYLSSVRYGTTRGKYRGIGTRYPLRPVPIPSTAITYNNVGLVEPVGDLTLARKREEKIPRGRYEAVYTYTDIEWLSPSPSLSLFPSSFPFFILREFLSLSLFCDLAFYRLPTGYLPTLAQKQRKRERIATLSG